MTKDKLIAMMADALAACLYAELERRKQLKDGAPASTYTKQRIAKIEAVLTAAKEMGYGPGK